MSEHVDDQEARRHSVERMRQQAATGYVPAARRLNGHDHAPAAEQINWAQVIAQQTAATELRFERELATLKETLSVAKSAEVVADDLSEKAMSSLIKGLAKSIAPFVKGCIKEAMATRDARLDELENAVRTLMQSAADSKRVAKTIPHGDADYKSSGRFVHAVGGRVALGHE